MPYHTLPLHPLPLHPIPHHNIPHPTTPQHTTSHHKYLLLANFFPKELGMLEFQQKQVKRQKKTINSTNTNNNHKFWSTHCRVEAVPHSHIWLQNRITILRNLQKYPLLTFSYPRVSGEGTIGVPVPSHAQGELSLETYVNCDFDKATCRPQVTCYLRLVGPVRDVIIRPKSKYYKPGQTGKFTPYGYN